MITAGRDGVAVCFRQFDFSTSASAAVVAPKINKPVTGCGTGGASTVWRGVDAVTLCH